MHTTALPSALASGGRAPGACGGSAGAAVSSKPVRSTEDAAEDAPEGAADSQQKTHHRAQEDAGRCVGPGTTRSPRITPRSRSRTRRSCSSSRCSASSSAALGPSGDGAVLFLFRVAGLCSRRLLRLCRGISASTSDGCGRHLGGVPGRAQVLGARTPGDRARARPLLWQPRRLRRRAESLRRCSPSARCGGPSKLLAVGDFSSGSSLAAVVFGKPTRVASGKAAFGTPPRQAGAVSPIPLLAAGAPAPALPSLLLSVFSSPCHRFCSVLPPLMTARSKIKPDPLSHLALRSHAARSAAEALPPDLVVGAKLSKVRLQSHRTQVLRQHFAHDFEHLP